MTDLLIIKESNKPHHVNICQLSKPADETETGSELGSCSLHSQAPHLTPTIIKKSQV